MPQLSKPDQVGLVTRHAKEAIIAPILRDALGWHVVTNREFDTDQLGTFSGETPRTTSALGCARQKARLACELTGLPKGLGSEGSFDDGPYGGLLPWDQELVTLFDQEQNWCMSGIAHGPSPHHQCVVQTEQQLVRFINEIETTQGVILYPQSRPPDTLFKGLRGHEAVLHAYRTCQGRHHEAVVVEFDLRAMHFAARRQIIAQATHNLVARWRSRCPACQRQGFWPDHIIDGLPCQLCHGPSNAIARRIAVCEGCQHEQAYPVQAVFADPVHCSHCNP